MTEEIKDQVIQDDPYLERFLDSPSYREVIEPTIKEAFNSFKVTRCLSAILFGVGTALILMAALFAVFGGGTELLTLILGGLGTANIIALLVSRPIEHIQLGVHDLIKSQVVLLSFVAQYDSIARYLATMSKVPMNDPNRNVQLEFEMNKHLAELPGQIIAALKPSASLRASQVEVAKTVHSNQNVADEVDNETRSSGTRSRESLYSWDYEHLGEPNQWFRMARAYIDCSLCLFSGMGKDVLVRSFYHARAAAFMFEHAVELFLKAGIAQAGKEVPIHHNLQQLYNQFSKLYPGKKYSFKGKIADVIRPDPNRPYPEFTRYPANHAGQSFETPTHFSLSIWEEQLRLFSNDFKRLEPLLKERHTQSKTVAG